MPMRSPDERPPAADDLLACLRWEKAAEDRLSALTADEWNVLWRVIEDGAGQHLLARRLQLSGIQPPKEIAASLRAHTMAVAARNLAGRTALAAAIRETGRPALLLKGIDLAERLYGNLGLRPMGDIDFLVRREDVASYDVYLRSQGYEATPKLNDAILASKSYVHLQYRTAKKGSLIVELHWRLAEEEIDCFVDMDKIWHRAVPSSSLAPGAYVLAPEDLLLHLCLHLKHHTFETPLTQIWDLAEILRGSSLSIDWSCVWVRAEEWNLTVAVRIALYLVSSTLGVSVDAISNWTPNASLAKLMPDVFSQLGCYPQSDRSWRMTSLLSTQSNWKDRYRSFKDGILPPRVDIRASYGCPEDTFWNDCVCYLRRWQYLVRRYGKFLCAWLIGGGSVKAHEREAALRRYLDATPR